MLDHRALFSCDDQFGQASNLEPQVFNENGTDAMRRVQWATLRSEEPLDEVQFPTLQSRNLRSFEAKTHINMYHEFLHTDVDANVDRDRKK